MPERPVGVRESHIRHSIQSKEGGSLTVVQKNEFIARSFGHIFAIPMVHLPLLTPDSMFKSPSEETVSYLVKQWKDVPWKSDVLVRVGHTSVFGDIARSMAKNKDMKGAPPRWVRMLALPVTVCQSIGAKFMRYDHYNAFTNTVHIFHADKAVGMGRIAQAAWFDAMDDGLVKGVVRVAQTVPGITGFVEWKTFEQALPKFRNDAERRHATKIYEPYWGMMTLRSIAGPFKYALPPGLLGVNLVSASTIGGAVGGHVMARLYPKQEQRFGWVFGGAKPDPALSDRTVRFGMADATASKVR